MSDYHTPVLVREVLEYLKVVPEKKYVDCTLGGGGHSKEIIKAGGIVLGIDQDQEALEFVQDRFSTEIGLKKLTLRRGNFAHLKEIVKDSNFNIVDGILFDLGVSSHQLDTDYRGFSFNKEAALDMRMDQNLTVSALDLVNAGGELELASLFRKFGEENWARPIAKAIIEEKKRRPVTSTNQLANIILRVRRPGGRLKGDRMHPATRVFQALRIAVNNELENLTIALPQALDLLDSGGRLVVISFHSLEEKIVKDFFKSKADYLKVLTTNPITASFDEMRNNPRARSARLRAAEKI